jgi:DNA polymerase III epsilon subunit-like protein
MYLFFDTETTGIPRNYKASVSDLKNWPRLVQIAWLLTDEEANEVSSAEYMVKPEGFVIPMDAAKIHGITTELAHRNGAALPTVLTAVAAAIKKSSVLVAHNMQFDEKILGAEFLRSGYPNLAELKERTCTMQASTNYCRLPGPYALGRSRLPAAAGTPVRQRVLRLFVRQGYLDKDDAKEMAQCGTTAGLLGRRRVAHRCR